VQPDAKPGDLVRPGHIFPLRARDGGVLVRTGQTEGSVDLARLAGLNPAGVICEIMNPDGTMSRRPQLVKFAKKHGLTLLSVADITRYRLRHDQLVRRVSEGASRFGGGDFRAIAYQTEVDQSVHVALGKGDVSTGEPTLTRVHRACLAGDLLGATSCSCGLQLQKAMERIREEGRGVIVYLERTIPAGERLDCTHRSIERPQQPGAARSLREFGVGAQILRDLGLRRLRLLTNNPKTIVGLESYGLELVEQLPLTASTTAPVHRIVAARRGRVRSRR
jgi:3,4-dihydroxy 2-butanone 4-phosphate synthase / GTP cyclohydrolase II